MNPLYLLAALVLVNDTLSHARDEPVLTLRFVFYQLLELLVKFVLSGYLMDLREVTHVLLEGGVRVDVVRGEAGDHGLQELGFVPEIFLQVVILMVLLSNSLQLFGPICFTFTIE